MMNLRRSVGRSWLPFICCCFNLFLFLSSVHALSVSRAFPAAVYDPKHNRIVYAGGASSTANVTNDVFAINLQAFNRSDVQVSSLGKLASPVTNAALVHTGDGVLQLLGGTTTDCASKVQTQRYNISGDAWSVVGATGALPTLARTGARAAVVNGKILYFGGRSVAACSTSQYYYNTLFSIDPKSNNWTNIQDASPPVAQADMTMTPLSDGSLLLFGGESAGSSGKASWVGTSQFAVYGANASAWSYVSAAVGAPLVSARSGHSAAFNGSHTFIYGGAIGSQSSDPVFLSIKAQEGALKIVEIKPAGLAYAPPTTLYGHTAVMTKNSIMVLAFGKVGAADSTTFNSQVYLYDTVANTWLDAYDPTTNPGKNKTAGLSVAVVAGIIAGIGALVIAGAVATLCLLRRRRRQRRAHQAPMPRVGSFNSDDGYGYGGKEMAFVPSYLPDSARRPVSLPPWAALHACRARSTSPGPASDKDVSINQVLDGYTDEQAEHNVQDRMVQIAMPASPRFLTFTAPKLQLRVVNPSIDSARSSLDLSYPELLEMQADGVNRTVPLSITDEDDLEHLRIHLATTPIVSDSVEDFQNQLAGLGLILREEEVVEPSSGTIRRVRTLTKKNAPARRTSAMQAPPLPSQPPASHADRRFSRAPRLSVVSTSSGLGLDSVIDQVMSPGKQPILTPFTERSSPGFSYSPYLDSPRASSHHDSPSPTPSKSPRPASQASQHSVDYLRHMTSPSPDLSLILGQGRPVTPPQRLSSMQSQTYSYRSGRSARSANSVERSATGPPQPLPTSPTMTPFAADAKQAQSPGAQSALSVFSEDAALLPSFEPSAVAPSVLQSWMRQYPTRGSSFRYPARPGS